VPLFPDLPVPAQQPARDARAAGVGLCSPTYIPRCKPMRTAQYFSRELVRARDARRKTECYLNMIAAVLAKDGAS
jgi:hypothetical protein